jgi:hypothetical protein
MFAQGKALSTLKGYLSAFTAIRGNIEGYSFHSHPDISTFIKGVLRLRPPLKKIVPCWELQVVLDYLSSEVFEPPLRVSLADWTLKTVFLIAITSVSRASELQAIDIRPQLSRIRRKSVSLKTNPAFLPKVLNPLYVNRHINIQAICPDPRNKQERLNNLICPVRALNIYLDKSQSVRKPDVHQLFVTFKAGAEGNPVSKSRISSWLVQVISRAYSYFGKEIPPGIKGLSSRALGASLACERGMSMEDICRAATWSSSSVFAQHYRLDTVPEGTSLSHVVLNKQTR